MSLDGGYIGSVDHAIANYHTGRDHGIWEGRRQGHDQGYHQGAKEGYNDGYNFGYNEGHKSGYRKGWDACLIKAEVQIHKGNAEIEKGNAEIEKANQIIPELNGRIARQQEYINQLEEKNQQLLTQVKDLYDDYNRSMPFIAAVTQVLEEITRDRSSEADNVRLLFEEKYIAVVNKVIEGGYLDRAPELYDRIEENMPRTRRLIINLLKSAKEIREEECCTPA